MKSICGIDCDRCGFNGGCRGCVESDGKPFGGNCIVAECCKNNKCGSCGGFLTNVCGLKSRLIAEFNALGIKYMEEVTDLYALKGSIGNPEYTLPGGQAVKFFDDNRIYLGNQLRKLNSDRCYGLIADENCLLVCESGEDGTNPEIVVFKKLSDV